MNKRIFIGLILFVLTDGKATAKTVPAVAEVVLALAVGVRAAGRIAAKSAG